MRSRIVLGAVLALAALSGCGGAGSQRLATVGDRAITRGEVDRLLEHAREEARSEHRAFPADGSAGYRALEREALAILVSRAQLEAAARRLGITVSAEEVSRQLGQPPPRHKESIELAYEGAREALGFAEEDAGEETAALKDAVRAQLTLQKVVRRVGAERVPAWLAKARRTVAVGYADGWAP